MDWEGHRAGHEFRDAWGLWCAAGWFWGKKQCWDVLQNGVGDGCNNAAKRVHVGGRKYDRWENVPSRLYYDEAFWDAVQISTVFGVKGRLVWKRGGVGYLHFLTFMWGSSLLHPCTLFPKMCAR